MKRLRIINIIEYEYVLDVLLMGSLFKKIYIVYCLFIKFGIMGFKDK